MELTVPKVVTDEEALRKRNAAKGISVAPDLRPISDQDALGLRQESRVMRESMTEAMKKNPDEFGKALRLSRDTNLSLPVVEKNLPEIEQTQQAKQFDWDTLRKEHAGVYKFMSYSPDNMAVSYDIINELKGMEWAMTAIPKSIEQGQRLKQLTDLRFKELMGNATQEEVTQADALDKAVQAGADMGAHSFMQGFVTGPGVQGPLLWDQIKAGGTGYAGGAAAGALVGAAATAAFPGWAGATPWLIRTGGKIGAGGMALAESFRQIAAGDYGDFKNYRDPVSGAQLDPDTARVAAAVSGAVSSGLEVLGLGAVLKTFPGADKLLGGGGKALVKQALQNPTILAAFQKASGAFAKGYSIETLTEVAQGLVSMTVLEVAKANSGKDFQTASARQVLEKMSQTFAQTMQGAWLLPATGAGATFIVEARKAQKAERETLPRLEELGHAARGSKLAERDPVKFTEAVKTFKAEHPESATVYVDAEKAGELFQADGLDGRLFFDEVLGTGGGQQFTEALTSGGRVAIPVEIYTQKIARTDWHNRLKDHAAYDEEGMTYAEAQEFNKEAADRVKQFEDSRNADDPFNAVYDDAYGQLIGAGRSLKDAGQEAQFYTGIAKAMSRFMTPEQFRERFPLSINKPLPEVLTAKTKFNQLDPYLDALREGKLPKDDELFGPRLISEIIKLGGINPESVDGGDLKAAEAGKRVGLLSAAGKTVEAMAQALAEGGWSDVFTSQDDYGRPDYRELLDLIMDDLTGEVRNKANANLERLEFRNAAESLGEELRTRGIDVMKLANADITKMLAGEAQGEGALNQGAQPVQTDTPAFKKWFGDSKVVDADGKPLVVYHGTKENFNTFKLDVGSRKDTGWLGKGFYFLSNAGIAGEYAMRLKAGESAPRTMPVYLSIQNPFVATMRDKEPIMLAEHRVRMGRAKDADHTAAERRREELIAQGYDGVVLEIGGEKEYVAFYPTQIKSAIGNKGTFDANDPNILNQSSKKSPRGSITGAMPGGRDKKTGIRKFKISLFKKANLSTFIHETGHMAFAIMSDLAADFAALAPESLTAQQTRLLADHKVMLDWVKAESFETMTTAQLEKVARGMEAYVMEGKAPSTELANVFSRLRQFMVAIYKTIKGLDVELTDEVRGVFDRLLATDEQIAEVRKTDNQQAIFNSPEEMKTAGMNEAEIIAYQKATEADRQTSVDKVSAKVMAYLKRTREKEYADLRETVKAQVTEDVDAEKVFIAINALSGKNVPDEMIGLVKPLDKEWLLDKYGQAWLKNLRRTGVYRVEDGMNPDVAASLFGYSSGRELAEAIATAPNRIEYIKAETERRLGEIVPDPVADGTIADEAIRAIHNEHRGEVLALELKVLERRASKGEKPVTRQIARAIAERVIADKTVREIRPDRYRSAERKAAHAAMQAVLKGDFELAAKLKRQELLNFYLWKIADEAKDEAGRAVDTVTSYLKKPALERLAKSGPEFVAQVTDLLGVYGFRPRGEPALLREWVESLISEDRVVGVADSVIERSESRQPISYRDIPMRELRDLRDSIKSIATLARRELNVLKEGKEVAYADAKEKMLAQVESLKFDTVKRFTDNERNGLDKVTDAVRGFADAIYRPQSVVEALDGGDRGVFHDFVYNLFNDAQAKRDELREKYFTPVVKLVEGMGKQWLKALNGLDLYHLKTLDISVDKKTLLAMASHMGNASNKEKLMAGGRSFRRAGELVHLEFTQEVIQEVQSSLTEAEWKLIQGVWDVNESLWPEYKKFQEDMGGLVPEKIEHVPFTVVTSDGKTVHLRGGYVPVKYDPEQSAFGAKQEASEKLHEMSAQMAKPSTRKTSLKSRTQVTAPLMLDFGLTIGRHLDEVITDISHRPAVLQANKILDDKEIKKAIIFKLGRTAYESLKGMVGTTVGAQRYYDPTLADINNATDKLLTNFSSFVLGLKIPLALANYLTGFTQTIQRVKVGHVRRALWEFRKNPTKVRDFVWGISPFMKHRANHFDQSYAEVLAGLRGRQDWRADVMRFGFSIHRWSDYHLTMVQFLAKYQQEMAEHGDAIQANRAAQAMIEQTISSGAPKDLSGFERSPQMKMFKMFAGPMIIQQNRIRDAVNMRGTVHNLPEVMGSLFAAWVSQAIIFELLVGRGPKDEDEDDDLEFAEIARWAAIKLAINPLGALPYFRDAAGTAESAMNQMLGGDSKYTSGRSNPAADAVSAVIKGGTAVTKAGKRLWQGKDVDEEKLAIALIRAAGPITGLPLAYPIIPGDFIYDVVTGAYDPEGVSDLKYLIYPRPKDKNP